MPFDFSYLILLGVKEIRLYFLPVGHTHGQIDQYFSVYSVYLRRNSAKALAELRHALFLAYNNPKKKYKKYTPKKKKEEKEEPVRQRIPVYTEVMTSRRRRCQLVANLPCSP